MSARQPTPAILQLTYALARQVPDMQRGFVIQTCYGEIPVISGHLADQIQALIRADLQRDLAALEQ